jgi:hypothetical protein
VSFSYECHSRRDVPVNPKIYRVRGDLMWEDVVFNSARDKTFLNGNFFVFCFVVLSFFPL